MSRREKVSDIIIGAADSCERGEPFDSNPEATGLLKSILDIDELCGDSHEGIRDVVTTLGPALSHWRSGVATAEDVAGMRRIAQRFRHL